MTKLVAVLLGLLVSAAAILCLAIDREPLVQGVANITPADVGGAVQILHDNDPRRLRAGDARTIVMSQGDLHLAANYIAHLYGNGAARIVLNGNDARVTASIRIPNMPFALYVNIDAVLMEAAPLPRFERIRLGRVPIPPHMADRLLTREIIQRVGKDNFDAFAKAIKKINISKGALAITYEWHVGLEENIRSALLPLPERERLKTYHERLNRITRALSSQDMRLPRLLSLLFNLAEQRSHDRDPVAENRAALLILAFYINELELDAIVPEAKEWPRPVRYAITLHGRDDYAKHFIISAALAAKAGGPISDAVALYKELADARGPSGFSLDDIAAGRAGALFGEKAVENATSARRLQVEVAVGITDDDTMPAVQDLPVSMSEVELKQRFGGVDTRKYRQIVSEIDRRLSSLTLYR